MQDRVKNAANEAVMGLLFVSLLVIYLVVPQGSLVTFLCVVILAISLIVAVSSDWSELNALAVFAGIISLVAAFFLGRTLRFGTTSGILLALLWGGVLYVVSQRLLRDIRLVATDPDSPAILIAHGVDRRPYVAEPPLVIPWIQPVVAIIPRKVLIDEIEINDINTQGRHNIDKVVVHVRYQITDPVNAFMHTPQVTLNEAAQKMNKSLAEARLDVTFWENLFEKHLLKVDVIKAVREVVFEQPGGAVAHYDKREELAKLIRKRLNQLMDDWGATAKLIELDHFKLDPDRVRNADPARRRDSEVAEAEHLSKIEAARVKRVLSSEVEAEADRVKAIIEALRVSNVEITPDVVIRAIRAASDWVMESDYTLLPTTGPTSHTPPPKPADKK